MKYEIGLIIVVALGLLSGAMLLAFYAWVGFWSWFDDRMQDANRIKNEEIDAAYSTGQFYVPYTMRDMK